MDTTHPPSREEILAQLQRLTVQLLKIPAEKVRPDSRLREDFNVDSLFMTQFVLTLEDDFAILTDETDVERFITLNDVADYVLEKNSR